MQSRCKHSAVDFVSMIRAVSNVITSLLFIKTCRLWVDVQIFATESGVTATYIEINTLNTIGKRIIISKVLYFQGRSISSFTCTSQKIGIQQLSQAIQDIFLYNYWRTPLHSLCLILSYHYHYTPSHLRLKDSRNNHHRVWICRL